MSRSMIVIAALVMALGWTAALASSGDQPDTRAARDWRNKFCVNCQPQEHEAAASRFNGHIAIATKLVAPNTCADPGPSVWFAEEEDHLSAYLNSGSTTQYK
jgi:hypothetical protein